MILLLFAENKKYMDLGANRKSREIYIRYDFGFASKITLMKDDWKSTLVSFIQICLI